MLEREKTLRPEVERYATEYLTSFVNILSVVLAHLEICKYSVIMSILIFQIKHFCLCSRSEIFYLPRGRSRHKQLWQSHRVVMSSICASDHQRLIHIHTFCAVSQSQVCVTSVSHFNLILYMDHPHPLHEMCIFLGAPHCRRTSCVEVI